MPLMTIGAADAVGVVIGRAPQYGASCQPLLPPPCFIFPFSSLNCPSFSVYDSLATSF